MLCTVPGCRPARPPASRAVPARPRALFTDAETQLRAELATVSAELDTARSEGAQWLELYGEFAGEEATAPATARPPCGGDAPSRHERTPMRDTARELAFGSKGDAAEPPDVVGFVSSSDDDATTDEPGTPDQAPLPGDAATTGVPTARSESSSAGSEAVSGLRGVLSTLTKKQRDYEELITLQSEMLEHYEDVLMSVTAPVARVVDPSE